jgi:AcrR family transcriptional regulator
MMTDRLAAKDWLDQGLKSLTELGFPALKAEPLAKVMGVSRGSFYWHFSDVETFHAAILEHWREVAVEQIIADIDASPVDDDPIERLLRRAFSREPALESAIRSWSTHSRLARAAVQAVDRRRRAYIEYLLEESGLSPELAAARAHILYWAFLGFVVSEEQRPGEQAVILAELIRMARAPRSS